MGEWMIYARHTPDGWDVGFRRGGHRLCRVRAVSAEAVLKLAMPKLMEELMAEGAQAALTSELDL